jgi:hypothetical protein
VERDAVLHAQTNITLTASLQPREVKKRIGEAELVKAFRGEAIDLKLGMTSNATTAAKSLAPKMFGDGTFESESSATNLPPAETHESKATAGEGEEEKEIQQVRDVVLQHAVDILKGIRVLLSWRQ